MLGRLSFEAQEQGVDHQHTIYYLLESGVSWIGLVLLGILRREVELNKEVCKRKEIAYFAKIYPSEASPSWAMTMVG